MGYVPPYAQWYLAEIVQELTVVGDPRNMVLRNLTLIRGDSPESAYGTPSAWEGQETANISILPVN